MNRKNIFILALILLFLSGTVPKLIRFFDARKEINQKYTVYYVYPSNNAQTPEIELPAELKPYYSAQIYSKIDGLLKERYVNLGDKVKKGQFLALVDAPIVDSEYLIAKANSSSAQKALIEAQYKYNFAKTTFERYKKAQNAVSIQEFKQKETDFNTTDMELKIAKSNLENINAQLKRANEMKNYERIISPFDGVITSYNVDKGSNIVSGGSSTSTVLFEIAQIDKLRLRADIPQSNLGQIEQNKEIKFYIPENPNKFYSGKIQRTQKSLNSITRTMKIEVVFNNKNNELYPGQFAKIVIPQNKNQNSILVKNEYIITDNKNTSVLTVINGKLHFIPVTIGNDYGETVEIIKGLKGNEKIVTNYTDSFYEGEEVIEAEAR